MSSIGEVGDSVCISGLIEHVDGRKTGDSEENRVKKGKKVDIGHVPRGEQCPDLDRRRSGPVKTDSDLVWSELIISENLGKDLKC